MEDVKCTEDHTDDTITTNPEQPFKVCYSSDADINAMLSEMWPVITKYMEDSPDHTHAQQWKKWIADGLTCQSGLGQVKQIMGIKTMAQLYLTLRDSPYITPYFNVNWDHKIQYTKK
jgi:hypothetical protein